MKKYKIVLLSGDGIGPEISEVSKKVLKKLSKNHNFDIEIIEKLFVFLETSLAFLIALSLNVSPSSSTSNDSG